MAETIRESISNPADSPSARFFDEVGINRNMRVLDVGCGNGSLSRLVAGLAGPGGEVVAIDRDEKALAMGREFDHDPHAAPISYRAVDLADELPDLGLFDAIVSRRVLMYLPDAATTLERLALLAKPGAILAIQEHVRTDLPYGLGSLPLHKKIYDWMWDNVGAEGGDAGLALRLPDLIQAAGFKVGAVRSEAILFGSKEPSFLPLLVRVMLPRLIASGVLNAGEVDLNVLANSVEEERRATEGVIVWDLAVLLSARFG